MNNDIKLIMMDLDGTLLKSDNTISEENKAALDAARNAGIGVTIATGRMHISTSGVAEELKLDIPFSTYNGGLITDPQPPYKERSHHKLKDDQSRKIIELLRPFNTHVNAYIDDRLYVEEETPEIITYSHIRNAEYKVTGSYDNLPGMECTKLLIIEEDFEKMTAMKTLLQEKSNAEVFLSSSMYCEILPKGINKGWAVDFMASHLGIKAAQIMTMGDQENDIPMLEKAGFGVAMGNALENIKSIADWVSLDHNENGVAAAIRHFLPELNF